MDSYDLLVDVDNTPAAELLRGAVGGGPPEAAAVKVTPEAPNQLSNQNIEAEAITEEKGASLHNR